MVAFAVFALVMAVGWAFVSLRIPNRGFMFGFARGAALGSLIAAIVLGTVR